MVQWEPHSGLNQFWQLEYQGKGLYIIRSMIRKELMLGFKNGMPKEGEELVTVVKEDSALWRIIGEWPRPSPIYV